MPYHIPFACARTTPDDGYYNRYAAIVYDRSEAYGFPFSDRIQPAQVSLGAEVATLRITILADDALDAPRVQSAASTDHSITLNWNAVSGAHGYTITLAPPLGGQTIDARNVTSYTVPNLASGTPYALSVAATDASTGRTSEAIPLTLSTTGSVAPVTGDVTWNFIVFFTPSFPGQFNGDTIVFNGVTKTLPGNPNPNSLTFSDVPGQPGAQNEYVFEWKNASGEVIYSSTLYVKLEPTPASGLGSIDEDPFVTFMANNQNPPTFGPQFNLFLSIAPRITRTLCK